MRSMVITGGGNGIGLWMVQEWLEQGNTAAILDVETQLLNEMVSKFPGQLLVYNCNITDRRSVISAVENILSHWSKIDIVVHNACVCRFAPFAAKTVEEFSQEFAVNYFGCINVLQAVLPSMVAAGQGKVMVTSSGVGLTGYENISGYASTKGALESLVKCLKLEYMDRGIKFHILHPPLTQTKSSQPLPIPKEFKANPEKVGRGLVKRIDKKSFYIGPTAFDTLSAKMSYFFPLAMGKLLKKMSARAVK